MKQMQQVVLAAADSTPEPFERIARAIGAYLEFFEVHPHHVELLIQERAIFKDRKQPTYFEYRQANRGKWRQIYVDLIAAGRLRADLSPDRIVDTIGALLYGTMFTNHFVGRAVPLNEQARSILEIIFRGLLSEDERRAGAWPPNVGACESQIEPAAIDTGNSDVA
jgi:hypothetical protein